MQWKLVERLAESLPNVSRPCREFTGGDRELPGRRRKFVERRPRDTSEDHWGLLKSLSGVVATPTRCHCGRHYPRITIPVGGHYARRRRLRRHQLYRWLSPSRWWLPCKRPTRKWSRRSPPPPPPSRCPWARRHCLRDRAL
ncbi:hypothetical protein GW17_00017095 [Ensete ventricosum]|nr:hypothetical protein GW17_00017095 [Ensete ventricosum]